MFLVSSLTRHQFAVLTKVLSGLLHIVQYMISGESLVTRSDPGFLPDWGQPGKLGANLAHYPTDATRDVRPIRKYLGGIGSWAIKQYAC